MLLKKKMELRAFHAAAGAEGELRRGNSPEQKWAHRLLVTVSVFQCVAD